MTPHHDTLAGASTRWFSREAIRDVDRVAVERYGMPGVALMENAAAGLLHLTMGLLQSRDARVLLLCGPGNNGGDGFALARRLHNAGVATMSLLLRSPDTYAGDAATNLRVLESMDLPRRVVASDDPAAVLDVALAERPALIVDSLVGTGLTSAPRDALGIAIARVRDETDAEGTPVLAVDVPSGLDCDSGEPFDASRCIRATVTATMAGLKMGFRNDASRAWTGRTTVVDIGAPLECLESLATIRDD